MPSFDDFSLQAGTRAILKQMEITEPTPIQEQAIPALLMGSDVVGQSATGSGKTLAYGIPLIERLAKERVAQALIMLPTRELATQVNTVLSKFAASRRLTTALLVGGRSYMPQISALRYGAQIIIGTPGRIKDHLDQGTLNLGKLRICVLDEADQMLDIGFAPEVEAILATTPETRQMALFSATMPEWIAKLEQKFLKEPVRVTIVPAAGTESTIEQIAYQVPRDQKMAALCTLLHSAEGGSSLIFGKTKFGVEKLGLHLSNLGFRVGTLHGNKSQNARDKVLAAFRRGEFSTLLATNVAARGLDITGIHQVINYELPESSELFTHRIGRTGRMGRQGKAITLLVPGDISKWRRMARTLGQKVVLEKLAIDEEALTPRPQPEPVILETQEPEQQEKRRQRRERSAFSESRGGRERRRRYEPEFPHEYERGQEPEKRPARAEVAPEVQQSRKMPVEMPAAREDAGNEPMRESRAVRRRKQFGQDEEQSRSSRAEFPVVREYEPHPESRAERRRKLFEQDAEPRRGARSTRVDAPELYEHEYRDAYGERPVRERKRFVAEQEIDRYERPVRKNYSAGAPRWQQEERGVRRPASRGAAWESEEFPRRGGERFPAGRERSQEQGRRGGEARGQRSTRPAEQRSALERSHAGVARQSRRGAEELVGSAPAPRKRSAHSAEMREERSRPTGRKPAVKLAARAKRAAKRAAGQ